jgi:hypothetical protein
MYQATLQSATDGTLGSVNAKFRQSWTVGVKLWGEACVVHNITGVALYRTGHNDPVIAVAMAQRTTLKSPSHLP